MVLLVVDAQKSITNENLYNFELFVSRVRDLIAHARNNGIEVIYIRHDDGEGNPLTNGAEGFEIYDGFKPIVGELIFDNKFMSAEMTYKYYNEFMWNKRYAECISFEKTLEMMNGSNLKIGDLDSAVPCQLKDKVLYVENDRKDIWDWSEKVYSIIESKDTPELKGSFYEYFRQIRPLCAGFHLPEQLGKPPRHTGSGSGRYF